MIDISVQFSFFRSRIESRWLPVFVSGKEFQARQRPRTNSMSDIIETVMSQQHWAKRMNSVERETINNSQHGSQAWKTVRITLKPIHAPVKVCFN